MEEFLEEMGFDLVYFRESLERIVYHKQYKLDDITVFIEYLNNKRYEYSIWKSSGKGFSVSKDFYNKMEAIVHIVNLLKKSKIL